MSQELEILMKCWTGISHEKMALEKELHISGEESTNLLYYKIVNWFEEYKRLTETRRYDYLTRGLQKLQESNKSLVQGENVIDYEILKTLVHVLNIQIIASSNGVSKEDLEALFLGIFIKELQ